mmetsp:Transcript_69586/g.201662  ORF Transcript_69586/g.201662 Transcript_69586/m.201662 type:complete len:465 (+) Transcript_69586:62-1456(+)
MNKVLAGAQAITATTVGAASSAAHAAGDAAQAAGARTASALSPEARKKAMDAADWSKQQVGAAAEKGWSLALQGADKLHGYTKEFYIFLEIWLKRKVHEKIEHFVDRLPDIIKDASDDPEMPGPIQRGKNKVIDKAWPDIREELLWNVTVAMDAAKEQDDAKGSGPDCIRAFFRYHLYPCDKTFWALLKDPVWIVFTLASLIPWAGMTPLIFLFIFIIIDKTDEYQLITFILQFKGTQFLSHGVIKCIMGFFMFIGCVTVPAKGSEHSCDESGPGVNSSYVVVVAGWLLQVVLIAIAFALLPWSKEKGRKELKGNINRNTEAPQSARRAGGYIRNLLAYDLVMFLICIGVIGYVLYTRPNKEKDYDDWVVQQAFFSVQVVYGLCAFPFFFFTLPVLQAILTHSIPTKYDSLGRACAIVGPPKPPKEENNAWKQMLSVEEAQKLWTQIQEVALGRISAKDAAAKI